MESFCPFLTSPGMATFSTAAEAIKFPSVAQPISYTSSKWSPRIYDRPIPCIQLSLVLVLKSNLLWLLVIIHLPQQTDSTLSPMLKFPHLEKNAWPWQLWYEDQEQTKNSTIPSGLSSTFQILIVMFTPADFSLWVRLAAPCWMPRLDTGSFLCQAISQIMTLILLSLGGKKKKNPRASFFSQRQESCRNAPEFLFIKD